jgi:hypothetical protein
MLPFLLYLVTGLAAGAQILWLVMWAVWGRPTQTVELAACFASAALLLVAYVALFSVRAAAWLALPCALVQWAFYAPAVWQTLVALINPQAPPRPGAAWLAFLVFVPALLSAATGVHAFAAGPLRRVTPEWLFPARTGVRGGLVVAGCTFAVVAGAAVVSAFFLGVETSEEHEMRWSYSGRQGSRGAREVVLVFVKHPMYYERFFSDDLGEYLESTGSPTVRVRFRVTRDFGKVRGYGIERVGHWPHADQGWSGGGSGCGDWLPPCVDGAVKGPSPWAAPQ